MKIYGKKTIITDCEWELENQPGLKEKLTWQQLNKSL